MNFYTNTLRTLGFSQQTYIQDETWKHFDKANELVLYAPTGSGKTLAFLLPIIEKLQRADKQVFSALIFAPTRELALQIEQVFKSVKSGVSITACYGGHSMKTEVQNLAAGPQVVVGTPGRLADHLRRGNLDVSTVEYFIIDEFDKCLEIGFLNEMVEIYREFRNLTKSIYCSATKLDAFPDFIKFKNCHSIDALGEMEEPDITFYKVASKGRKLDILESLVSSFDLAPSVVFCNFRGDVDGVFNFLDECGIVATAYHGGMEQDERERALIKFRNGSAPLLICTDLGARGLDIPQIKHVVHFQLPEKEDAFIHRNGRTARMSEDGNAYVFDEDIEVAKYELPVLNNYVLDRNASYHLPKYSTVYFSGGKKDKINKIDLVGFICQKGGAEKEQIGMISVLDTSSYVALDNDLLPDIMYELRKYKVKGQKLRIAISK